LVVSWILSLSNGVKYLILFIQRKDKVVGLCEEGKKEKDCKGEKPSLKAHAPLFSVCVISEGTNGAAAATFARSSCGSSFKTSRVFRGVVRS